MRTPSAFMRFHRDEQGWTGPQKALGALLSFGVLIFVIRIIMGGANSATDETNRMLLQQGGWEAGNGAVAGGPGGQPASGALRTLATPLSPDGSDRDYDGALTGADGKSYDPKTPLDEIPPVMPENRCAIGETTIYVNGIDTTRGDHQDSLQDIANKTGGPVIGVYNATEGPVKDLIQSGGDKLDLGTNKAVDTLADTVYDQLSAGKPVHLMGHSQGGLIVSRALDDLRRRLIDEDGMTEEQAEELMSHITVETFGAASRKYPDGPRYVHYVNVFDPVPMLFGLGRSPSRPGRDAEIVYIYKPGIKFHLGWPPVSYELPHGFEEYYLPKRKPID